jgi:hypothetical protein
MEVDGPGAGLRLGRSRWGGGLRLVVVLVVEVACLLQMCLAFSEKVS